jgi:cell division protein FtsW (lipid II flippase)
MYAVLLTLHSLVRWLVLISLLFAIVEAYRGWLKKRPFTKTDDAIRIVAVTTAHLQLVLGICLYAISPVVRYFLNYFKQAVHEREIRFFGMEHVTMMVIAIILVTIGSAKVKRQKTDQQKFKTMAIWFTIALVIIFLSIPWHFSPFTRRPYFRWF